MGFEIPDLQSFRGLNLSDLKLDEAYLNVTSAYPRETFLYKRNENCDKCPFQRVDKGADSVYTLSTHYPWHFRFRSQGDEEMVMQTEEDSHELCTQKVSMGEFGVYSLRLDSSGEDCPVETSVEPVNAYSALIWCSVILIVLGLLYRLIRFADKRGAFDKAKKAVKGRLRDMGFDIAPDQDPAAAAAAAAAADQPKKRRLKSLDTFRGITIALMIFVNDQGGGYYFMEHAAWNGLYVADFAFPWFMWIMGFCIPMSIRSSLKKDTSLIVILWRILVRSVKLFLLGFFWGNNNYLPLERVRIPSVLVRFSVCYLVVASTAAIVAKVMDHASKDKDGKKDNNNDEDGDKKATFVRTHFVDVLTHWPRWIVAVFCALAHTLIIFLLPVPGCETGYLGPGGLHDSARHSPDCVGGATGYVDRLILTSDHIYRFPTPQKVYGSGYFDPEGVLGSLTSIFQVFLGYQAGQIILSFSGHRQRVVRFLVWGVVCGLLALILCGASVNDGWIPINKNLWSLSYVFATTGAAFVLMALIYVVIDVKHWWGGEPFFYAGMNSIVLYLGHSSAWAMMPFNYAYADMNRHWDRLPESIWGVSAWMLVAYVMYRKKVFITV